MAMYEEDKTGNPNKVDRVPHRECPLPDGEYQELRSVAKLENGYKTLTSSMSHLRGHSIIGAQRLSYCE